MRAPFTVLLAACAISSAFAGKRDDQVNGDKADLAKAGNWIYNDLEKGFAEARASGKPLFVVYRCIP